MSSLDAKKSQVAEAPIEAVSDIGQSGPAEVGIGRVVGLGPSGAPLVTFPANPTDAPITALATARYEAAAIGRDVALLFLDGDPARPLAIGLIAAQTDQPALASVPADAAPEERLTFTATREIVLQCGRASLVLTRAGKVLVRGAYLSLRSTGMHRITGASVQIN